MLMRARVVTLVLMLVLGMIALAPHAVGQEEPDSELSKLIRSFRDAQVAGDRVVVTDTPTPVNPFGGDVGLPTDVTDTISVVRSTEFVINGGPPYTTFDPMATDILYSTPRDGMVDLHEIMPSIPQNWVPLSVPDGFVTVEQALAYMFTGRFFPADFLEQFAAGEPIAIDGMVLTPPASGVMPPLDQPWMI
jgi:hypothetical protein